MAVSESAPQAAKAAAPAKKGFALSVFAAFLSGAAGMTILYNTHILPLVAKQAPPASPVVQKVQAVPPAPKQESLEDVVARTAPSVVEISCRIAMPVEQDNADAAPPIDSNRKIPSVIGTGSIVDGRGYILTNYHVVSHAVAVNVTLQDRTSYSATIVGYDRSMDIAVLKIDAGGQLPTATFGDSDAVRPGDPVFAIGTPSGFAESVSKGIVSSLHRVMPNENGISADCIQTDAPINPGNSGGPLFNEKGEVVGMTEEISTHDGGSNGLGFAIPSSILKKAYGDIMEYGSVRHSTMGVADIGSVVRQDFGPGLISSFGDGIVMKYVIPGGPADNAGLEDGDIITAFDGKPIKDANDLLRALVLSEPGSSHQVTAMRDTQKLTVTVVMADAEIPIIAMPKFKLSLMSLKGPI